MPPRRPAFAFLSPSQFFPKHLRAPRRFQSTQSTPNPRIDRVLSRLPKFLHPYTNGLRSAPVSHVVAFLILHEITAVLPLLGLAGLFHYTEWLPKVLNSAHIKDSYGAYKAN